MGDAGDRDVHVLDPVFDSDSWKDFVTRATNGHGKPRCSTGVRSSDRSCNMQYHEITKLQRRTLSTATVAWTSAPDKAHEFNGEQGQRAVGQCQRQVVDVAVDGTDPVIR